MEIDPRNIARSSRSHSPHRGAHTVVCDLHICPSCGSHLVYPLDWEPAGTQQWQVSLRCPECEWHACGTYPQAALDEYDRRLDLGTEALIEDLKMLTKTNMEDEITAFAKALEVDLIIPSDF